MKKPGLHLARTLLCALACPAALVQTAVAYKASTDLPFIYESFDRNPLGNVLPASNAGTPSFGYGIIGDYSNLGTWNSAGVTILDGNLTFGALSGSGGKKLQINGESAARGVSMMAFMGKALGDIDFYAYDKLYCAYLVRYGSVGNDTDSRGEMRVTVSGSLYQFTMHSDSRPTTGALTSQIQPAVSYQTGAGYSYGASPSTQYLKTPTAKTYMMIGRFTNVGNLLSVQTTGTWTAGAETMTVAAATNITIGQLVTDRDNAGSLAANTRVSGISGTTIYLSKPTLTARTTTNLDFNNVAFRTIASDLRRGTWVSGAWTITMADTTAMNNLRNEMVVTAASGIAPGTKIQSISGTVITLTKPTTAAGTNALLTFRAMHNITATGPVGKTIEIDHMPMEPIGGYDNPRIYVGALLKEVPGKIDAGTYVDAISSNGTGRILTLSKPLLAGISNEEVTFLPRVGRSTMFALDEAQFNHFTSGSRTMIDADLDAATIGDGPTQVSARIEGAPQTTGSWEFLHGRKVEFVAHKQTMQIDELRFGFNLQAVTQPAVLPAPTPNTAQDDFSGMAVTYRHPFDGGYGWKSGYFQLEESAPTRGATVGWSGGASVSPTSGTGLIVYTRREVSGDQGTSRRPDPAVVDMTQPYTVEFDYVPFLSGDAQFTAFSDRIQIGANGPSGAGVNFSPNPSSNINVTWMVGTVGNDDTGTNRLFPGKRNWYFFDYDNSSSVIVGGTANHFVSEYMVDTGILVDGQNFRFKIEVDAPNYIYHATVTKMNRNDGSVMGSFSRRNLRFRNQAASHTIFWGASKPAGDARTFLIDNVKIAQGITAFDQFPAWIGGYTGVPVGMDGRNQDADGDGSKNFLEFALNGSPNSGADGSLVSNPYVGVRNGLLTDYYHTLLIPVRRGTTFPASGNLISNRVDGLTYQIQGSSDLINWDQPVQAVMIDSVDIAPTLPPGLNSNWTYKMFRLTTPGPQRGFLRAVVTSQ